MDKYARLINAIDLGLAALQIYVYDIRMQVLII